MSDDSSEIVRFPKSATQSIFYPLIVQYNEDYVHSLRDRSWKLAPIVWSLVEGGPRVTWEKAATDKRYADQTARCLATCELMIRLLDVITSPQAIHDENP